MSRQYLIVRIDINHKEYQQIPPKKYSLTQMGQDLSLVVKEIHHWILQYDIQN
ncbi:MAG: winged helix-turn-helix transcriptional regulator [Lachnospiraceae bacterium]